jgi:hypothetical protein
LPLPVCAAYLAYFKDKARFAFAWPLFCAVFGER